MKYTRSILFALFSTVVAFGCRQEEHPLAAVPMATVYQYEAFDLDSTLVATGTLSLIIDAATISGQRDIKGSGPESGTGELQGTVMNDGSIQIVLSPGQISVVLQGKPLGTALVGERLFDTGGPPVARTIGFFLATRADVVVDKQR